MTEELSIHLNDLKPGAQQKVLEFLGNDGNYDVFPLFILTKTEEDKNEA